MTPGVDLAHELAEARRRLDELESLVENSSVAIVLMGYGVLAELKDDSHLRDIPMVMTSSLDEIDSVVKCIEMGAEDYLTKPINPVLLNARVTVSLEKKRLRDQQPSKRKERLPSSRAISTR